MKTTTFPAWYDGPVSARTEEEVMVDWLNRFSGASHPVRNFATTPLAPPPTGTGDIRPSKTIGRVKAGREPIVNNFSKRKIEREWKGKGAQA